VYFRHKEAQSRRLILAPWRETCFASALDNFSSTPAAYKCKLGGDFNERTLLLWDVAAPHNSHSDLGKWREMMRSD
jgi:hypothetical protein